jgi:hypothetical protein
MQRIFEDISRCLNQRDDLLVRARNWSEHNATLEAVYFIYLFIFILMNLLSNLHTYYIRYKDKNLTNERQNTRHKSQISRYTQTEKHKRDTKSPVRGAPRN